jgi:hypothetical protein
MKVTITVSPAIEKGLIEFHLQKCINAERAKRKGLDKNQVTAEHVTQKMILDSLGHQLFHNAQSCYQGWAKNAFQAAIHEEARKEKPDRAREKEAGELLTKVIEEKVHIKMEFPEEEAPTDAD